MRSIGSNFDAEHLKFCTRFVLGPQIETFLGPSSLGSLEASNLPNMVNKWPNRDPKNGRLLTIMGKFDASRSLIVVAIDAAPKKHGK